MVAFDTLKASRRLRDAGFEEKQADALVNAFAEDIGANLATKDDIAQLKGEIALLRRDMTSGFESLRKDTASGFESQRKDTASEIASLRKDTATEIASVRQDMALLEQRLKLRIALAAGGATTMILTALGVIAGIIVSRL